MTDYITVNHVTGVGTTYPERVKIYPNPAIASVSISFPKQIGSIEVFDLMGKQMLKEFVNANSIKLDISGLDPGLYFINIKTEKGIATKKLRVL